MTLQELKEQQADKKKNLQKAQIRAHDAVTVKNVEKAVAKTEKVAPIGKELTNT